jgi:hypothetical protein
MILLKSDHKYYTICWCETGVIKNVKIYRSDWRNKSGIQACKPSLIKNIFFKFIDREREREREKGGGGCAGI